MAQTPIVTDPNALRAIIHSYGGRVIPAPTFQFDLALSDAPEVIPKLNASTGLGVRKISERQEEHPTKLGCTQSVATLELYRRPAAPER